MNLLQLDQIYAGYHAGDVLKGISLSVASGEIVALLGANGAGKTTTLLAIAGVLPLRGGSISWKDEALANTAPDQMVKRGVCLSPEGRRIFPRLTVMENLLIGAYQLPDSRNASKLDRIFSYFPRLAERRTQLGGTLSGGEQQMLAMGRALMGEPELLMLDEPSLGLAPIVVEKLFSIIQEINRAGTAILLVEQNAHQALQIAHRGSVLVTGKIVLEDSGEKLLASDEVRRAYLGEAV